MKKVFPQQLIKLVVLQLKALLNLISMLADVLVFLLKLTVKLTSLVKQINSVNLLEISLCKSQQQTLSYVRREEVPQEDLG